MEHAPHYPNASACDVPCHPPVAVLPLPYMTSEKLPIRRRVWRWLVRRGFHLLYNELAWTYDIVSWLVSLGEWRKWQAAALPYVVGDNVLEIAHGPGHMLLWLAQDGRRVTGIDFSPYMGRLAARRLRRTGKAVRLVRGKVQTLPFADETFDTVYSSFPTAFMAERKTMQAVYRVLREDGRYIIVPEGHLTGSGVVERFIDWLFRITGQRSDVFAGDEEAYWPAENPHWRSFLHAMEDIGFLVDVHHVELARSAATVIVASRNVN